MSFALLRCAIMCILRSRSSAHHNVLGPPDLLVVLAESRPTNKICLAIITFVSFFKADSTITLQLFGDGHK